MFTRDKIAFNLDKYINGEEPFKDFTIYVSKLSKESNKDELLSIAKKYLESRETDFLKSQADSSRVLELKQKAMSIPGITDRAKISAQRVVSANTTKLKALALKIENLKKMTTHLGTVMKFSSVALLLFAGAVMGGKAFNRDA